MEEEWLKKNQTWNKAKSGTYNQEEEWTVSQW